jgi:hypothetical protein
MYWAIYKLNRIYTFLIIFKSDNNAENQSSSKEKSNESSRELLKNDFR